MMKFQSLAQDSITISGTSVTLGGSITDETLFGGNCSNGSSINIAIHNNGSITNEN